MKTLVLFAHPNPKSFNAALCEMVADEVEKAGGQVTIHDLYQMNFNPILHADDFNELFSGRVPKDVKPLQEDIAWAELIVTIFPTWWAGPPAILKGYFDRVLTNGFAYRYGENGLIKLLEGKKAMIFQTAGSPREVLGSYGLPEAMKKALDPGTWDFCGVEVVAHELFYGVPTVSDEERTAMLEKARDLLLQQVRGVARV